MTHSAETFQPFKNPNGLVTEDASDYVRRMQATVLPDWPADVLVEWLHRHANDIAKYVFLDFPRLTFRKETWPLERIPGREAFDDACFCDAFSSSFSDRVRGPHDWLAIYMDREGTWNTPIVLLANELGQHAFPWGEPLKRPFHLMEGHRRLSFLNALRQQGRAQPIHEVWVATKR